eukprot:4958171-Prymnesium_polylepis.1
MPKPLQRSATLTACSAPTTDPPPSAVEYGIRRHHTEQSSSCASCQYPLANAVLGCTSPEACSMKCSVHLVQNTVWASA